MGELSNHALKFLKNISGKRIVFTNGCFDIIHAGHVMYLNQARKQGDFLFVGLNSDSSIKRLKGNDRPINNQEDRKYVLENLSMVDFVEIFEEDTPLELIKLIKPSVLVKGGDWKINEIVGYDIVISHGGEVKSLTFKDGYSTTGIIQSLQGKG